MQKYVKTYLDYFDIGEQELLTCEACGKQGRADGEGFDIHHIWGRAKPDADEINNIICLCRRHHEAAHSRITKSEMQMIHNFFMMGDRRVFLK
jgi:5-methylcytosine-specific restriction endonuclease McrA